jgi:hypothetical protein
MLPPEPIVSVTALHWLLHHKCITRAALSGWGEQISTSEQDVGLG